MQRIVPHLWYDGDAEAAARTYAGLVPGSAVVATVRYPDVGQEVHGREPGSVMFVDFRLGDTRLVTLNGGPLFRFNESISFIVWCADQDEIDFYWSKLSHVPESEQCGWCKDRFGVSWQVIPANMADLTRRPEQVQVMMRQKKIVIAELEQA